MHAQGMQHRVPARSIFHPARRVRPLQAWRAIRHLLAEPDATYEVFRVIEALKGGSLQIAVERMFAHPDGRRLIEEKPDIKPLLNDWEALRAMPEGSLGRAYLEFVEDEGLSAQGLVEASETTPRAQWLTPEELWIGHRLRDIHDLQHVLAGYGRDQLGELSLLGFMTTQTWNRGIDFIIYMGRRKFRREAPQIAVDACVEEGREIGRNARWLATIRWEDRLADNLEALRREIGIGTPRHYLAEQGRWPQTGAQ